MVSTVPMAMLHVGMALIVVTTPNILDIIYVDIRPVVFLSKDLVSQGSSTEVSSSYAFVDLSQGIVNPVGWRHYRSGI